MYDAMLTHLCFVLASLPLSRMMVVRLAPCVGREGGGGGNAVAAVKRSGREPAKLRTGLTQSGLSWQEEVTDIKIVTSISQQRNGLQCGRMSRLSLLLPPHLPSLFFFSPQWLLRSHRLHTHLADLTFLVYVWVHGWLHTQMHTCTQIEEESRETFCPIYERISEDVKVCKLSARDSCHRWADSP